MEKNNIQIFNNEEFGQVRAVIIDGIPHFVGKEVAEILGYRNTSEAIADHIDEDDKFLRSSKGHEMLELFITVKDIQNIFGRQDNWFISESGVYSLVFGSKLPSAKKFKRWVTAEVLPTIRRTGSYVCNKQDSYTIDDPIKRAERWIEEQKELKLTQEKLEDAQTIMLSQAQEMEAREPKVNYVDLVLKCTSTMSITQIAKDYNMTAQEMNNNLHELGVQYKSGNLLVLYNKHVGNGYTRSETFNYTDSNGKPQVNVRTKWTQKGRMFIYNVLKDAKILPNIEREDNEG